MDGDRRDELDRKGMAEQVTEKVWHVPAYEGSGPVTMKVRVPEVTITDSAGRFIVISPRQTAIVGSRLECINDWLQYGAEDHEAE